MTIVEPLNGTLYWQEIREGLFVHNEGWNKTIDRLSDRLSFSHALSKLETVDLLLASGFVGTGTIGKRVVSVQPEPDTLRSSGLFTEDFTTENLFLQWLYRFYLVESFAKHFHDHDLPNWPIEFIKVTEECLHAMTYIAALILLYEEGQFKTPVSRGNFEYTEAPVKEKVKELTATLYSKTVEYGESFRRHGLQGILPRLWDKIARYAQLSALGRDAQYEPKRDSAKDLLGYCIIAWSLVHELDEV